MSWSWENGTPRERANIVRSHAHGTRPLSNAALRDLFCLTPEGLLAILRGLDWCDEFSTEWKSQKQA